MPVRIRLSRGGAKKRPFYRIVVADSRRARDGKFIDQIGTYNPMLPKDSADRVKMDVDKAKEWISKGSGTKVQDVNRLLKQFLQSQKMMKRMKSMGKGGVPSDLMQKLQGNLPPNIN